MTRAPIGALVISLRNWWRFTPTYWPGFRPILTDGAEVRIAVPHPRHDDFLNDPTHVRAVTVEALAMFSKKACDEFVRQKAANTPLAHMLGVDFEMEDMKFTLEQPWLSKVQSGAMGDTELLLAIRQHNNVIKETSVKLRVKKS